MSILCSTGKPATDEAGQTYSAKLAPNDDHQIIAGSLTRKLRDALIGKKDALPAVSVAFRYPKIGIA
jgi:hypothetical protein